MRSSVAEMQWVRVRMEKDEVEVRTGQMVWGLVEQSEDVGTYLNRRGKLMEDFKLGNDMILFAFYEDHFLKIRWAPLKPNKD